MRCDLILIPFFFWIELRMWRVCVCSDSQCALETGVITTVYRRSCREHSEEMVYRYRADLKRVQDSPSVNGTVAVASLCWPTGDEGYKDEQKC